MAPLPIRDILKAPFQGQPPKAPFQGRPPKAPFQGHSFSADASPPIRGSKPKALP